MQAKCLDVETDMKGANVRKRIALRGVRVADYWGYARPANSLPAASQMNYGAISGKRTVQLDIEKKWRARKDSNL